jgi:hypothetical protein
VSGGKAGRERDRTPAGGFCVLGAADRAQRVAEVGIRFRIVGPERGRAAEMLGGLLEAAELAERGAEIVVRLMVIGPQRQHGAIARLRLGRALRLAQQVGELVVALQEARIERDGAAERGLGLPVAAQDLENEPERVAAIGALRRERDRALRIPGGRRGVARAQGDDGEEMPGACVRLVARQDRAAGRLRVGEPPRGLFRIGALEQLLERRLRALGSFLGQLPRFHTVNLSKT